MEHESRVRDKRPVATASRALDVALLVMPGIEMLLEVVLILEDLYIARRRQYLNRHLIVKEC